ncbi:MAG: DUF7689 domain-containing protein [Stellaceae bacterium]
MSGSWNPAEFPNLHDLNHSIESRAVKRYNCIAWAANDDQNWWWPDGAYWPNGVAHDLTIQAFVDAFATLGYAKCSGGELEPGFEKIALYAERIPGIEWEPTHAARQLQSGCWTSKLGPFEDIEHLGVDAVADGLYGTVAAYLKRPIEAPSP